MNYYMYVGELMNIILGQHTFGCNAVDTSMHRAGPDDFLNITKTRLLQYVAIMMLTGTVFGENWVWTSCLVQAWANAAALQKATTADEKAGEVVRRGRVVGLKHESKKASAASFLPS